MKKILFFVSLYVFVCTGSYRYAQSYADFENQAKHAPRGLPCEQTVEQEDYEAAKIGKETRAVLHCLGKHDYIALAYSLEHNFADINFKYILENYIDNQQLDVTENLKDLLNDCRIAQTADKKNRTIMLRTIFQQISMYLPSSEYQEHMNQAENAPEDLPCDPLELE